jgi:hypothetical protein
MKMTLQKWLGVNQTLVAFAGQPIGGLAAFTLARLAQKLEPEVKAYHATLLGLRKKHGAESKDRPGTYAVDPEDKERIAAFSEELTKVLDADVEVETSRIPLSALADAKVSVATMMGLDPLIDPDA